MENERKILGVSKTVFSLGVVSLLTDVSSEMLVPIIPQFLKFAVGASMLNIGLIEGVAECVASVLRVYAGYLADKFGRPKALTVIGYGLSALSKPFYLIAHHWPDVLGIRFADRFGKGIRSAPRDVLIADTTPEAERGRAFGLHRAMDTTGAMLGPIIIAILVMAFFGKQFLIAPGEKHRSVYQLIFLAAMVPAVLGWLVLVLFVPEKRHPEGQARPRAVKLGILDSTLKKALVGILVAWLVGGYLALRYNVIGGRTADVVYVVVAAAMGVAALLAVLFAPKGLGESAFASLSNRYKLFLAIVVLFSVGNSSDAFLVVRATSKPISMSLITFLLVWAAFNGLSALVSLRSGVISDRIGRKPVIVAGWLVFAAVYFAMARITTHAGVWIWFIIYGAYYGMTEGMLRAYAVDLAPANLRGTAVGAYFTFTGIALLPASLIAGFLWDRIGPSAPFYYGSATALASALLLGLLIKPGARPERAAS